MNTTATFKEAKRLHKLGFAIHWLHPQSKRPVETGWTTGPRKQWHELSETYVNSFNVGVRLGTPSLIGGNYLAVIDVDVKSTEPHHRKEAIAALRKIIGQAKLPEVRSGRGNGSRHCYCVTAEPFQTWNPAASEEKVKALMPSKSPSKRELSELTESEIKQGLRIANAWEISLYSEGRQVVLPPSIHPDTLRPYFWAEHFISAESLPLIEFPVRPDKAGKSGVTPRTGGQETVEDFEVSDVELAWLTISDRIKKAIISGVGVNDRSAHLLPAANALVSAGLSKNEILTVLTERKYFLGECAYDHAQTNSRKRAAQWLWNYTVKRVMEERDPVRAFKGKAIVEPATLEPEAAEKQAAQVEAERGWKADLERTDKGHIRNTFNNCKTILTNVCDGKAFVGRNEFAANDYYLCNTPWRSQKGDAVTDVDIVRIKAFCCEKHGVEFSDNTINTVLIEVADKNRFHPVRTWLKGLEWDGVARLETWLQDFASATGISEEYLQAVSRKVLVAMVKRVFQPGCKFDHVLILEGIQGAGKSTLLSRLAAPWFSDETLNIGDKDAVLTMQSKWLIELGELSALSRAEIENMKAFITRTTDRIRAPYGKRVEEFPRQCIFIGSTNQDEYLRDETGNRRFWPVSCGQIDFEGLTAVRDQLFAEAYQFYLLGEPLYLESKSLNEAAVQEQAKRAHVDEWLPTIRELVKAEGFPIKGFEMREVSKRMDQFGANRLTPWDQQRIGKCLRLIGFEKFQEPGGERRRLWQATKEFMDRNRAEPRGTVVQGSTNSPIITDFY